MGGGGCEQTLSQVGHVLTHPSGDMEKTAVFTAPITTGTRNTRWSVHQGRVPRKKSILGTQTLNGQQRGKRKQQQGLARSR